MKAYSFTIIICCACRYASVEIKPELQKIILTFGIGINFKYEEMLAHSFDIFYIVTKFILSTIRHSKFSAIDFDKT